MMPKKLSAYLPSELTVHSRSAYSMVNRIVKNHSMLLRVSAQCSMPGSMVNITTPTLAMMAMIIATSKALPAGVSISWMILRTRARKSIGCASTSFMCHIIGNRRSLFSIASFIAFGIGVSPWKPNTKYYHCPLLSWCI